MTPEPELQAICNTELAVSRTNAACHSKSMKANKSTAGRQDMRVVLLCHFKLCWVVGVHCGTWHECCFTLLESSSGTLGLLASAAAARGAAANHTHPRHVGPASRGFPAAAAVAAPPGLQRQTRPAWQRKGLRADAEEPWPPGPGSPRASSSCGAASAFQPRQRRQFKPAAVVQVHTV